MATSPNSGHDESCESMYAYGLCVHQKSSNYTSTNLLFGLFKSVWIIGPLVIHHSPHSWASTHPSTPKMLQAKECTLTHSSSIVFILKLAFKSFKECEGCASMAFKYNPVNKKCLGMQDMIRNFQDPLESIPSSKVESQDIWGLRFKRSKFISIKWYLYHWKIFLEITMCWDKFVKIDLVA
jgi:hypothetical protein